MEYRGYITPEEYELAEKNGISRNTLNKRIRCHGWNMKRACTEPPRTQYLRKNLTSEVHRKLKENNISFNTFTKRLSLGWSLERAVNTPVHSKEECARIANNSRRKITEEQYKRAEMNGISRGTFKSRIMNYHWDIETSINTHVLTRVEVSKRSHWGQNFLFGSQLR